MNEYEQALVRLKDDSTPLTQIAKAIQVAPSTLRYALQVGNPTLKTIRKLADYYRQRAA